MVAPAVIDSPCGAALAFAPMSPRGRERRQHERMAERLTLRTLSPDLDSIELETANLSMGGAWCHSSRRLTPMTRLKLSIFLPSHDGRPARLHAPLDIDAVVVRAEKNGDGGWRLALFFAAMSAADRAFLAAYLDAERASA